MAEESRDLAAKQQIRNFLIVILSGFAAAFLISGLLLYYYSPSGQYIAKNALVDPEVAENLAFNDFDPKTGALARYVFDGFIFSYYDQSSKTMKQKKIGVNLYTDFYNSISSDTSILEVPPDVTLLFNQEGFAKLIVQVRTESHEAWIDNTKPFQQIQLMANDYYRIELREDNPKGKWIYFFHPGIYAATMKLLTLQ